MMRELEFDGIIIGAGPNGLTTYWHPSKSNALKDNVFNLLRRIWECLSRT
jgi:ribulose 1,5-bisphosphate synthetase/thiazole synthase